MGSAATTRAGWAWIAVTSCGLLAAPLVSSRARAGDAKPSPTSVSVAARAAALKAKGDTAFDEKRYADALAAYREAYAIAQSPALLYNQWRALQFLDRYPEALDHLKRFRAEATPELRARVPTLDALITEIEGKVGVLALDVDAEGALVVLGDHKLGTTPLPPTPVNAGSFTLEITADGRAPYRAVVQIDGRKTTTISAKLASKSTQGVLIVRSATAGARVTIDGEVAGAAPVERTLPAKEHVVVVEADGRETTRTTVVLEPGARRELSIDLSPSASITSRWWFWTGIGVVAAAGVTTVILLRTERSPDHGSFSPGTVSAGVIRF